MSSDIAPDQPITLFITLMDFHLDREISDTTFIDNLTTSSTWGEVKRAIPKRHGMIERIEFDGVKIVAQDSTPLKNIIDFKKYPPSEVTCMTAYMFTPEALGTEFFKGIGFSLKDDDTGNEYNDNDSSHQNETNGYNQNDDYQTGDYNDRQIDESSWHTEQNSIANASDEDNSPSQPITTEESQYFEHGNNRDHPENGDIKTGYSGDGYIFTGENSLGQNVAVNLSPMHCIVVDRHDKKYPPYLLLSDTGKRLLSEIGPLDNVEIIRDPPRADTKDESNAPIHNLSFRQRVRAAGSLLVHSVNRIITDSPVERVAMLFYTVCSRTVVLLFFLFIFGFDSVPIIPLVLATVLTNKDIANRLEEIVTRDLPRIVQPSTMKLVEFVKLTSNFAGRLSIEHIARILVKRGISRDGDLDIHAEDRGFGPRVLNWLSLLLINVLKDVILLLVTLIPVGYSVFDEEMTKKEANVGSTIQNGLQEGQGLLNDARIVPNADED